MTAFFGHYLSAHEPHALDAASFVRESGVRGGLIVHVGCGTAEWTAGLRASDAFLVQGLEPNAELADEARLRLRKAGQLGPISIQHWAGKRLPYADNLVNLVIVEAGIQLLDGEVLRVLAPDGIARLRNPDRSWRTFSKPWPKDIDQWTHFLHGPDNNAVADDERVGPPHHLQWTAAPQWGRSHDQLASVSAVVSSQGRIFSIVDEGNVAAVKEPAKWFLVARDAFNGILLWKRPVRPWENHLRPFRSGPAELPRRLVAIGDRVYATLGYGKPVTELDAATGEILRSFEATEDAQEIVVSDGRLFVVAGKLRKSVEGTPLPELPEWLVPYPQWVYEQAPKRVVCLNLADGGVLWCREDKETANVLPLTLATQDDRAFFHNEKSLIAVDAQSGKTIWRADRPVSLQRYAWSSPTLVVSDGIILSGDRTAEEVMDLGSREGRTPRWLVSSGHDLFAGEIVAFDANTGKKLWTVPCHESFNAPVDVFVARGKVWSGQVAWTPQPGITQVYDLETGEVVDRRPPDHEFGRFGHHRCYRAKATVNYVLHSRRGIEFVDMDSDRLLVDRWTRGTCQYGILPCNGMIYTPPHSCACYVTRQLNGFNALAARESIEELPANGTSSLEQGPAYRRPLSESYASKSKDWPTYRNDAARSGATEAAIPSQLNLRWNRELGRTLTPPVIAGARVFVACPNTSTVAALAATDGSLIWQYSVGATVDSPPSHHRGRIYFGSADGWVYCLHASDGQLAWRHRVAPGTTQIVSYGRVESKWPVHGSLLVLEPSGKPPVVCGVAGRSTYLDGGMVLFGLDATTGAVSFAKRLYQPSPELMTPDEPVPDGTARVDVLPDVLSTDGSHLFMRNQAFSLDGEPIRKFVPHVFSSVGYLDDSWWHRTYWQYGTDMSSGYGGWITAGNKRISGRLLVQHDGRIFGFGRKDYRKTGSHIGLDTTYRLFSAQTPPAQSFQQRRRGTADTRPVDYDWSVEIPFFVRAMVLAGGRLFVAGPEKISDLDAESPEGDVWLSSLSSTNGRQEWQCRLPAVPVFDSLAAVQDCLFMTTVDGRVLCFRK